MSDTCNLWSNEFNPFQKFKVLAHHPRMTKIPTGAFEAPVNIALDLVQGTRARKLCAGVRCNFCMSDFEDQGEVARVPQEVLDAIPAFWKSWGVLSVCLAGHHSDPFSYDHEGFCRFVRLLYRNDIEVGINTNGLLMDDRLVQDVSRNCKWTGFSVNAGRPETYAKITGVEPRRYSQVLSTIAKLTEYARYHNLRHPVAYKYLITDDNYGEILDAAKNARDAGCRQLQIRPCQLPDARAARIDLQIVEDQIREALGTLERPGEFEVFGIREKFTADFRKKPPRRCIASPLGSTWKADGNIVICPDRRWSAHQPDMVLGNYITEGLEAIRRKWGGPEHRRMIAAANARIGECIRCTAYCWHEIYEHTVGSDDMDYRLI